LDLLSVNGLLNYFGKADKVDDITMKPLLLAKGEVRLALYGLGHIRDDRLNATLREKKVKWMLPKEAADRYCNILTLHQNRYYVGDARSALRVAHGPNKFIQDSIFPAFLDLLIWGHEHESLWNAKSIDKKYLLTQPGSTIPTSMCAAEGVAK
jgi:double-strand break repair protein MRE11